MKEKFSDILFLCEAGRRENDFEDSNARAMATREA